MGYNVYPTSVQLLERHKFYSLNEFVRFINFCEEQQFRNNLNWQDTRNYFLHLQSRLPFKRDIRFPMDFYVHIECANMKSLIEQFWKTLNLLNELIQSKANIQCVCTLESINNLNYAKQMYDAAFTNLATIIKSTNIKFLMENGIYCRRTFEEKYELTWDAKVN